MAGRYKPYSEYLKSDNYWFGGLPANWKIVKLKQVVDQNRQITYGIVQAGPNIEGGIPYIRPADMTDEHGIKDYEGLLRTSESVAAAYERSKVRVGDIICSIGPSFGKLMIAPDLLDGANLTQGTARVAISSEQCVRYFFWALRSPSSFNQWESSVGGATFRALNLGPLADTYLALPSKDEQECIANFLDHETAKIDTLIEKQQHLIQLLKEKRQAVISHAVTKGLSSLNGGPNAKMRDSGVEWLGEVPEHWVQIKTKHILIAIIDAEHKTAEYFEDGTYLVCRTTNVRDGVLKLDGGKYTNQETYLEWIKRGVPEPGDILFSREAPAGEACIVPDEPVLCLGQRMVLFKLNKSIVDSQFVLYSIYSGLADDFIKQLSQGSTVSHMNMADIINIPLFETSLAEQKEIVKYLDRVLSQYDELQKNAELTVELIQERRTALISAAVTGKIDVRDWVAPPASPTHKEVAA